MAQGQMQSRRGGTGLDMEWVRGVAQEQMQSRGVEGLVCVQMWNGSNTGWWPVVVACKLPLSPLLEAAAAWVVGGGAPSPPTHPGHS